MIVFWVVVFMVSMYLIAVNLTEIVDCHRKGYFIGGFYVSLIMSLLPLCLSIVNIVRIVAK